MKNLRSEITITGRRGEHLVITVRVSYCTFEAAAYSPAPGFSPISADLGSFAGLGRACSMTLMRRETCVLPRAAHPTQRILLTPPIKRADPATRAGAERLMLDMFETSRSPEVRAQSLLIKHFQSVRKYPRPHVQGVLDALAHIAKGSFCGLKVLGFEIGNHVGRFGEDLAEFAPRSPGLQDSGVRIGLAP